MGFRWIYGFHWRESPAYLKTKVEFLHFSIGNCPFLEVKRWISSSFWGSLKEIWDSLKPLSLISPQQISCQTNNFYPTDSFWNFKGVTRVGCGPCRVDVLGPGKIALQSLLEKILWKKSCTSWQCRWRLWKSLYIPVVFLYNFAGIVHCIRSLSWPYLSLFALPIDLPRCMFSERSEPGTLWQTLSCLASWSPGRPETPLW